MERKFDKRIDKDLIDVYTIFNRFSSDLIGTTVYASNVLKNFQNLENCKKGIVDHIDNHGFAVTLENGETFFFYFVIPAFSVKVEEKVFRPYTLREVLVKFPLLTTITVRKRGDNDCIITSTFTGYRTRIICIDVCLGAEWISLGTLADEYEYKNTLGNWLPFGVEE